MKKCESTQVLIWEEDVVIPTYEVGTPDKNPMFLEKRVYQGSSGKVYPLPVIDKIYDEKVDKTYRAVFLENEYLRIMLLPELGGRVQRAYDKTNGYDFVYYNHVIKPALVGLCGPWISGGIEINWPQHHRPTTYSPTEYTIATNADGSKTLQVSEVDQMYGTKGMASFTLYPGKAYLEIGGQLYNPTPLPQTFLWWANPAIAVSDHTQSVFPPDVNAVMDHGKRAVSKFPIATGTYYKHDYGEGVDISRYKNIPVPTSYMAYHSDYNFIGGYDYEKQAGILHVADHHIAPGKKQWTWGNGAFGKAWDRNLTDEDGPYIELMTGIYTDNQPDFTWLKPFEEKTFVQYFMPYKGAGYVKNASTELALNLEVLSKQATICVYAAAAHMGLKIMLCSGERTLFEAVQNLSPTAVFEMAVDIGDIAEHELTLKVLDAFGHELLSYTPAKHAIEPQPDPAQAAKLPDEINTNEELFLTGQHLEQYRHATFLADDYYIEGLKRDPLDSRINNAYGLLLLRRGQLAKSEAHFRSAIKRITQRNPNPYDSEAYYNLGVTLFAQERYADAYDAFYKATWTSAQQEMAFYYLAMIAYRQGDLKTALAHTEKALIKNAHNISARALKGAILKVTQSPQAQAWLEESLCIDPFDHASRCLLEGTAQDVFDRQHGQPSAQLAAARMFGQWGAYSLALQVLEDAAHPSTLALYYLAFYAAKSGDDRKAKAALNAAAAASPAYCFPNHIDDIAVLEYALQANPAETKAPYYLGNLYYDKKQYEKATALWERSTQLDDTFPTAWRNLSLAYYNKEKDSTKALMALKRAFALDTTDARVMLELSQLHQRLGYTPSMRLAFFDQYPATYALRDDLVTEYVTLLNLLGMHQRAYETIMERKFHPWEGGEGKITAQYTTALWQLALGAERAANHAQAKVYLIQALDYPENLGEGKLEGATDNHLYYALGCVCDAMGDTDEARAYFAKACKGDFDLASAMYYNDQPADLMLYQGYALARLGQEAKAKACFHRFIDHGEQHLFDDVQIDYFAVSLPNLQIFEEDLNLRNKVHCHYLIALGCHGIGDHKRALQAYDEVIRLDAAHLGAMMHRNMLTEEK